MKTYRPDIDGLRALSVAAVLAFHAKLPFVPGGFAGVDVFFTISGFLITGLLLAEHARTGRIGLIDFWARRVRRLAPALLFVLLTVALASIYLLQRISGEEGALAKATIATLLLSSNYYFLFQSGDYFSLSTESNPLLHMWSLSVEEQYYLIWPVLLYWVGVTRKSRLLAMTCGVTIVSFFVSLFWSAKDPPSAFYLMPSRAWELLAGALAAIAMRSWSVPWREMLASTLCLVGVAFVVGPFFFMTAGIGFPAPLAIIPTAGTVMVLVTGGQSQGSTVGRLLGSAPMAYLGKISYPLYLWHWPMLVFFRSRRLYEESLGLDLLALAISIVLAVFTYEVIEKRAWSKLRTASNIGVIRQGAFGAAMVLGVAVSIGIWVRFGIGYTEREKQLYQSRDDRADTGCLFSTFPDRAARERCFPSSAGSSILLWGDSHAEHWAPALAASSENLKLDLGVITMRGCRPLPPPVHGGDCSRMNQTVLADLSGWHQRKHLVGVIVSASWADGMGSLSPSLDNRSYYKPGEFYDWRARSSEEAMRKFSDSLTELVRLTAGQGFKLLIILPSPVQRYPAQHCLAVRNESECYIGTKEMADFVNPVESIIRRVAHENGNVRVFDPEGFMCADQRCPVVLGGTVVYSDSDHVTRSFSRRMAGKFTEPLRWLASRE